ncbi:MAG: EamA family transporter, partial [Candidatus Uhrbacteria bacterium]|nr:EamA family transporter [Candidatus Uhrbacteria bacterium]
MIEPWITLAILGGIGSNIYNFLARYTLKDGDDPTTLAWFFEASRFVIFGTFLIFERPPALTLYSFFILLLLGVIEIFSIYFFAKMHSLSHLSISSIIIRLRLVWIPILAFFFIHEILSGREYIGLLVLLAGIIIAGMPHKLAYDKGMRYAYIFSFVGALLAVTMKAASAVASPTLIMFAMSVPSIIVFPLLMKDPKKRILSVFKNNATSKISFTLLNSVSF